MPEEITQEVAVFWLKYDDVGGRGFWDQTILEEIFKKAKHYVGIDCIDQGIKDGVKRGVVVFPCGNQHEFVDRINKDIAKLERVVFIHTSDEWNLFPLDKIKHPNMTIWLQYPSRENIEKGIYRYLPVWYTPYANKYWTQNNKTIKWCFNGQVNNDNRIKCEKLFKDRKDGVFIKTCGFAQGDKKEYFDLLSKSKVALCPSGIHHPDSFRTWEALLYDCIPLVDEPWFWGALFSEFYGGGELPITDWSNASVIKDLCGDYESKIIDLQGWLNDYYIWLREELHEDVNRNAGN